MRATQAGGAGAVVRTREGGGIVRTPDGGDVLFRPLGTLGTRWALLRRPPVREVTLPEYPGVVWQATPYRMSEHTWDAPDRDAVVRRIAETWGIDPR